MPKTTGQQVTDTIGGIIAQASRAIEEQVGATGRQLDHANAQLAETRRRLAVERAASAAALDVLDSLDALSAPAALAAMRELRARMRQVGEQYGPTTPRIVGRYIRTGDGASRWTVDMITGQPVRLPDGRQGVVDSAFGSDDNGVESISVQPASRPAGHAPGPGDLVYDLSPHDVEFIDHQR